MLFEESAPEELIRAWEETGEPDCAKWQPTMPRGEGWFILSIHDTDDGPICIWARPLARIVEPPKHIETSPFPSAKFRYFIFDPAGEDFICYRTAEERDAQVKDIISGYCDEGWDQDVERVCVGEISGTTIQTNVEYRPEELDDQGCDSTGFYWDDFKYKCDYDILPFPPRTSDEEELKAITGMLYMLENREWAEHAGKGELSIRLEQAITSLHNELSQAQSRTESPAVRDVLAERRRQVEAEGFAPEQDDGYTRNELADASASYALCAGKPGSQTTIWPWGPHTFKPSADRRRDMVKSVALGIAEIERLDRAAAKAGDV